MSQALLGARDMLPMTVAVSIYGTAFGILAVQSGFSFPQSISMSLLVFAASAQLVALDQLVAGAGAVAAVLAGAAINLRMMLVTASMRATLTGRPWWQIMATVYLATDASIALMQTGKQRGDASGYWYHLGGNVSLLGIWVLATTIGALLSYGISTPERFGLDFAIVANFVALLPSLWRGRGDLLPWGVVVATVVAIMLIFPSQPGWALIIGAIMGAVTVGITHHD